MHETNVPQIIRSLLSAVEEGDSHKVQSILDQDISVETTDPDGNSLLQIAAANGHENVVRLLLVKGAALDRKNLYGWTPLMQAARYGHESVVLHLLNNKANVNITTTMGISALTAAVRGGHTKVVELLLVNNFVISNAESVNYFATPLMVAAQDGRDDVLRTLLRRGVPSDQSHKDTGWTALMITAMTGQLPMARLLVDKGCDPNLKNRHDKTALAIATECELREVRGYLDRKTTDKPEKVADQGVNIIAAVKKGDYKKVEEILQNHQTECNAATPDGATPLMYAAITGQTAMIELLVTHGADVNAKDYENGWTALMQATYYGKVEAAEYLIEKCNADVNCRTKNNITAFDMALLINADTRLFRLLAAHAMHRSAGEDKSVPNGGNHGADADPSNSNKHSYPTMAWQNTVPCDLLTDTGNKEMTTQTGKKGFWSKLSRTVRSIKLTKNFRNTFMPNKVESFENTLIASGDDSRDQKDGSQHGNSVTIADPYSMTNHSGPQSRLPEEKLAPIQPPFQATTGVDKQSQSSQKKNFGSKASMSTSLNSSGESSVSRSVVKPGKFLHSPGNSGRSNNGSSPHSSGGASDVTHSLTLGHMHGKDFHNHSGDRHSDSLLSKMAQIRQRKEASATASTGGRMRNSVSAEQLSSLQAQQQTVGHKRAGSQAGSVVSSRSSSTLTPPRSPDSASVGADLRVRSLYSSDARSASSRGSSQGRSSHKHRKTRSRPSSSTPSLKDDEMFLILRELSLQKYHPIFEKEEIDMETFLTMTNNDLRELGITQENPRQQLLEAINQRSAGKENYRKPDSTHLYSYSHASNSSLAENDHYIKPAQAAGRFAQQNWSYNASPVPPGGSNR